MPTTGIERLMGGAGLTVPGQQFPQQLTAAEFGIRLDSLTADQFRALQEQLYAAGAYPDRYYGRNAEKVPFGQRDMVTMGLLQNLAGLATFTGNLDAILSARPDLTKIGAKERAPLVIELPSREDMDSVLRDTAADLLGRDPTPDELKRYSDRFTAAVTAFQKTRYAAVEGGGTITQPPQAGAAAESFLRETSPVEVGAQRMERGLIELRKLFTGGQ